MRSCKVRTLQPLDATHLRIEFALKRLGQRQQFAKVRPTQLSPQCGDNLLVGKGLGKLDHPAQILFGIAATVLGDQLSRQRGDNLFPIGGAFAVQHLQMDALTDAPIEDCESYVDSSGSLPARILNQGTDLDHQFSGAWLFRSKSVCVILTLLLCIQSSLPPGSWIKC